MAQQSDGGVNDAIHSAESALIRLRSKARAALAAEGVMQLAAGALGLVIALAFLDYFFRFPVPVRVVFLLSGVTALVYAGTKALMPALRFNPSVITMALRIERADASVRGVLASGIEFAKGKGLQGGKTSSSLAQAVVDEAASKWKSGDIVPDRSLQRGGLTRALKLLLVPVCIAALLFSLPFARPYALVGAERVLVPFSGTKWPARTAVVDMTTVIAHPRGVALPIRAAVTKKRSGSTYAATRVMAHYELLRDGKRVGASTERLAFQRKGAVQGGSKGGVYERLLDVDAEEVVYWIETEDDRTPKRTIQLIPPPAVLSASVTITPPAYTSLVAARDDKSGASALVIEQKRDLGAGNDERAVAPAALQGAAVALWIELNKPVPADTASSGWIERVFGQAAAAQGLTVSVDPAAPSRWLVSWTLQESVTITAALEDEHGIASLDTSAFVFSAVRDHAPDAAVLEPTLNGSVLVTAVPEILGEGRDTVGIDSVWLEGQRFVPVGRTESGPIESGGPVEPFGPPLEFVRTDAAGRLSAQAHLPPSVAADALSLGDYFSGLEPDDQIEIVTAALDAFGAANGDVAWRTAVTRSPPRRLLVITEERFLSELRSEMRSIRLRVENLSAQQSDRIGRVLVVGANEQNQRAQAQLTDQIGAQQDSLRRLVSYAEWNRFSDTGLIDTLKSALETAASAKRSSGVASDQLARFGQLQAQRGEVDQMLPFEEEQAIEIPQRETFDTLQNLVKQLAESNWFKSMDASLVQLIDDQLELELETRETASGTQGRSREDLSLEQNQQLTDIGNQEERLVREFNRVMNAIQQRQSELQEAGEDSAEMVKALQEVQDTAQHEEVAQHMEQARQNAQQAQASRASSEMSQARSGMQQMRNSLQQLQRAQFEVLKKKALKNEKLILELIAQQATELKALAAAGASSSDLRQLDAGMIGLSKKSLGVISTVASSDQRFAEVAAILRQAARAQSRSVVAFRDKQGPDRATAQDAEDQSMAKLKEALDKNKAIAADLEAQGQSERRKQIADAYRELAQWQSDKMAVVQAVLDGSPGNRISRKDRQALSATAGAQEGLAVEIDKVWDKIVELDAEDAGSLFKMVHDDIKKDSSKAVDRLREPDAKRAFRRQGAIVAQLLELASSFDAPKDKTGIAREGQSGGGGGSSPPIPGHAKVRLMLGLQKIANRTAADMLEGASEESEDIEDMEELMERQQRVIHLAEEYLRETASSEQQQ